MPGDNNNNTNNSSRGSRRRARHAGRNASSIFRNYFGSMLERAGDKEDDYMYVEDFEEGEDEEVNAYVVPGLSIQGSGGGLASSRVVVREDEEEDEEEEDKDEDEDED